MKVAGYKVSQFTSDYFKLDGGAMFGSVPKTLWSKRIEADEKNRIPLGCRLLVLENKERRILIDVGMGLKWQEKERSIFAVENFFQEPLSSQIPDVSDVIITHLHFDHAGGVTYYDQAGNLQITYPSATTYVSQRNFEHAGSPGPRERASYLRENRDPLEQGELKLTQDKEEILPGIIVHLLDGHTKGMQAIQVGEGEGALLYVADLMPTAHHVSVPYVMGYDLCAETSMQEKERFLTQAAAEGWTIVFEHDRESAAATVAKDSRGRFVVDAQVAIPDFKS